MGNTEYLTYRHARKLQQKSIQHPLSRISLVAPTKASSGASSAAIVKIILQLAVSAGMNLNITAQCAIARKKFGAAVVPDAGANTGKHGSQTSQSLAALIVGRRHSCLYFIFAERSPAGHQNLRDHAYSREYCVFHQQ
jgi:hypothetical protein